MRRAGLAAAALAGSLLAAGCSASGNGSAGSAHYVNGTTFTEQINTDASNLDPQHVTDNTTALLDSFAYDTLVNIDPSGKAIPQLATRWQVTSAAVTFTLRKNVLCSDGSRLTARQVAANFDYVKNPASQSSAIGDQLPSTDFTVRADNAAGTVTVTMAKPYGFLLYGAGSLPIVCPKGMANRKLLARGTDGTGPFKLVEAVPDDHYTFAVRKNYAWGPGGARTSVKGFPAKVVFKVVQSESTAVNLLLSGQLSDVVVGGVDRKRLEGHGLQDLTQPGIPVDAFFNERPGHPGADPAVRRALAEGLDAGPLMKVITENDGTAPANLEPNDPKPCNANTVRGHVPGHDAAAARAALDAAGWRVGEGGTRVKGGSKLSISLLYPASTASMDAGMELVAREWKALGVDVTIKRQDANAVNQSLFSDTGGWDVAMLGIGVAYPSQLVGFLAGPAAPKGQNFAAIDNPGYQRLTARAIGTPGAAGCGLWAQAETALFSRADVVPLAVSHVHWFGNGTRYRIGSAGPEPTSIRMLGG